MLPSFRKGMHFIAESTWFRQHLVPHQHAAPPAALCHPAMQASLVKATETWDILWPQKLVTNAAQLSEMHLVQVLGNLYSPTMIPRLGLGVKSWPQTRSNWEFDAATLAATTISHNYWVLLRSPGTSCAESHTAGAVTPLCDTDRRASNIYQQTLKNCTHFPQKHPLTTGWYLAGYFHHPCETPLERLAGLHVSILAHTWFPHASNLAVACSQSEGTIAQIMTVICCTRCSVRCLILSVQSK